MKSSKKCLTCKKSEKLTRGLCHKDYSAVMKKIARGEVSERTLVRSGKLLPGKGITTGRDNKMFLKGANKRGKASSPGECLVRRCIKPIRNKRGLCITHHSYAYDLIRKGKASEEDLVKRRLMYAAGKFPGKLRKKSGIRKRKKKVTTAKSRATRSKNRKTKRKASVARRPNRRKNVSKLRKKTRRKRRPVIKKCRNPHCIEGPAVNGFCETHCHPEPDLDMGGEIHRW